MYEPKYWNNRGKYQKLYNKLSEELVPREGEADTERGEILRIVGNWYYDIYNNGGCNHDVHSSDLWKLFTMVPRYAEEAAVRFMDKPDDEVIKNSNYRKFLDKFVDWAVMYVQALEHFEGLEKELE